MDLKKMSVTDLEKLSADALRLAEKKKEKKKQDIAADIMAQIQKAGFTFDEIFPRQASKPARGRTAPAKVKYRHPEDPTLTWAGWGRKPKWLVDALDGGANLDSYAV